MRAWRLARAARWARRAGWKLGAQVGIDGLIFRTGIMGIPSLGVLGQGCAYLGGTRRSALALLQCKCLDYEIEYH
jgi:hypothetical protein